MEGACVRPEGWWAPDEDPDERHDPDLDRAVRHAVQSALTERQREAVELFFFEGLSQSEIARRLGVSQQVIQKRLYGAPRRGARVGGALAKLRVALAGLVR
jgi:RNA polymerase sigma factor (sigma-70 family)